METVPLPHPTQVFVSARNVCWVIVEAKRSQKFHEQFSFAREWGNTETHQTVLPTTFYLFRGNACSGKNKHALSWSRFCFIFTMLLQGNIGRLRQYSAHALYWKQDLPAQLVVDRSHPSSLQGHNFHVGYISYTNRVNTNVQIFKNHTPSFIELRSW